MVVLTKYSAVFSVSFSQEEFKRLEAEAETQQRSKSAVLARCFQYFGVTDAVHELLEQIAFEENADARALLVASLRRELLNPSLLEPEPALAVVVSNEILPARA